MARQLSAKKPKDLRYTLGTLFSYMGRHKFLLLAVAVLVSVSALANLLGTYMIRPVVNSLTDGSFDTLVAGIAVTVAIYVVGVLSAYGYTRFRELVQLFFPGSGLPTTRGSLVRYLARAS